ncbi:H/ACA ribonucleoprotein complex subunit 2-like [Suncus etruscus]|uniref:H/ACA ribonucleoprotein complex subunit 2-like n=1 Tax=Suncus etruscus TaxID=109475 RepID=UPI0021103F24|nr:H/ACA ribonucleoprotein complex subunit 2-like [Suncus etruscus]
MVPATRCVQGAQTQGAAMFLSREPLPPSQSRVSREIRDFREFRVGTAPPGDRASELQKVSCAASASALMLPAGLNQGINIKDEKQIRRGVKEVQKFLNKGEKGIMVLAGDTLPIEVYCHLPVMCEDRSLPYVYIPSKMDLGAAAGSKRLTCVIMIKPHEEYQDVYDECLEEVQALLFSL